MSTFKAEVVRYQLKPHSNAETLSIAEVKGWEVVVKTSDFEVQTGLGVYIPLDAVASVDHPLLSFLEGKRVKTRRLRGVYSQGVLLPLEKVIDAYLLKKFPTEGDDLTSILKVKKWEEPINPLKMSGKDSDGNTVGGQQVKSHPYFTKYTDVENIKNFKTEIAEGEAVEVSLKLHGTSARFGFIDGKFYVGSRNLVIRNEPRAIKIPRKFSNKYVDFVFRKLGISKILSTSKIEGPPDNTWNRVFEQFALKEALTTVSDLNNGADVVIYGEIVGVQKGLHYGLKSGELDFYVYDMTIRSKEFEDSKYISPDDLVINMLVTSLKKVPTLYQGSFNEEVLKLRSGPDPIGKTHVREGIVIKPTTPRSSKNLGRVVLKAISEEYLMKEFISDF